MPHAHLVLCPFVTALVLVLQVVLSLLILIVADELDGLCVLSAEGRKRDKRIS
jgi:hypothetical protein